MAPAQPLTLLHVTVYARSMTMMQIPEQTPWFQAPVEAVYITTSVSGASYVKYPLTEIHETTRHLTHDQQKLLALIPSMGIGDRAGLCNMAGTAPSTLRQWLWKSTDFRNCFYTLGEVELKELADFGQLHALMEVPGVVDRLIEFARQLKPDLDIKGNKVWERAPAFYAQLLAANDKLLKMAGVDTNKEKETDTKQTSVQLIINQINGARTERRIDVGGIAPIEVDYTIKP